MTNRRHSRSEMLAAAVDVAIAGGLHQLSFGRVALHLGIADRTVVYYFPTKEQLVSEVIEAAGARFISLLNEAFGEDPKPTSELFHRAWPILTTPEADQTFKLFFELVGLAASGVHPFVSLAPQVMAGWLSIVLPRVLAESGSVRSSALALIAQVDGLLLLRQTLGIEAANEAAQQFDPEIIAHSP
jgi:AcrR family transcriptional regulator